MSQSVKTFGKAIIEVILAIVVLLMIGFFGMGQVMEELSVNQQLSHYYKFKSQVVSVCERVKVNPNELQVSAKEYVVLYPFYDIRFYNQTGDMPQEVKRVCRGDKCACLVKTEKKLGTVDWTVCLISVWDPNCPYKDLKLEGVYSCFNMQELGCNNELWLAHDTTTISRPLRTYSKGVLPTCKFEGVVTWDRTGFFYDKLSEKCL